MSIQVEPPLRDEKLDGKYGADISHVEETVSGGEKDQWSRIKANADEGEAYEHSLTVWQSVKTYRSVNVGTISERWRKLTLVCV